MVIDQPGAVVYQLASGKAKIMKILEIYLIKLFNSLIVAFLAVMLVLVFGNVVLRYVFNSGITISEELSRIMFVWLTFLGAVVAMKEHAHLGIDTLTKRLSPNAQKFCVVVTSLLVLGVCGLVLVGSWQQTVINLGTEFPATGMPVAVQYAAGIVASVGIGAYLVRNIYVVLIGQANAQDLMMGNSSLDQIETHGNNQNNAGSGK
ncbi:TRAP transporter small permease [Rhodoferax fermentans]|uniref:TRAP transporter small permease n=1 Tax=Rhodoferax fermentans TaxID=28066 RepID=UPI001F5BA9D3|nr:TRAP transporter small permease [Rhodoferax fermentans]